MELPQGGEVEALKGEQKRIRPMEGKYTEVRELGENGEGGLLRGTAGKTFNRNGIGEWKRVSVEVDLMKGNGESGGEEGARGVREERELERG